MDHSNSISTPRNAWNIRQPEAACSFNEVMSEELAKELQKEEEKNSSVHQNLDVAKETHFFEEDDIDCTRSDLLLAQMMQAEFDKEHDQLLKREESKFNGDSKVSISFANYRSIPDSFLGDDDDSSDDDFDDPKRKWDSFEIGEKISPTVGKSGFTKNGTVITTKHDATICGRKNACKVMEFPPGISTGDGGGFDMKLSNSVYNHLKVHSFSEEKRHKRIHDKTEKSTTEQALDPKTRLLVFKLVNNGILEKVNGCISTGKESIVLHAVGGKVDGVVVPDECAIKVFKTTLNEFKNREKYIEDDYRFKDRFSKQNPRKMIRMWAEKEMHNLNRMQKAGIHCPEVVTLKKHILVMSFIGKDGTSAPKLKEAKLTGNWLNQAYQQTVEGMKTMYEECGLVHADLSEYNILWYRNQIWFIDVSQSVEPSHPQGLVFLYRDCCNISNFFSKQGADNVMSDKELFMAVSGMEVPEGGAEFLSQIKDFEQNEELLSYGIMGKNVDFDSMFEQSKKTNV